MIDNNFKMPQVWRSSLALDYTTHDQWKFSIEGIYTKVVKDLQFQQVNLTDNPTYYAYDVNKQQPIFSGKKSMACIQTLTCCLTPTKATATV